MKKDVGNSHLAVSSKALDCIPFFETDKNIFSCKDFLLPKALFPVIDWTLKPSSFSFFFFVASSVLSQIWATLRFNLFYKN